MWHSNVQQSGTVPENLVFWLSQQVAQLKKTEASVFSTLSFSHLRKFLPKAFLRSPSRAVTPLSRLFFCFCRHDQEASHIASKATDSASAPTNATSCPPAGPPLIPECVRHNNISEEAPAAALTGRATVLPAAAPAETSAQDRAKHRHTPASAPAGSPCDRPGPASCSLPRSATTPAHAGSPSSGC